MQFGISFLNERDPKLSVVLTPAIYGFITPRSTWNFIIDQYIYPFKVLEEPEHPDTKLSVNLEQWWMYTLEQLINDGLSDLEIPTL